MFLIDTAHQHVVQWGSMEQYTSRKRRDWMTWYRNNGCNAAATCRHFTIGRSTFYRWLQRYDPSRPQKPLRPKSRRPHTKRKPSWTLEHLALLSDLAAEHPRWGRDRLRVALAARDWLVSSATVGRMLSAIKRRCPVCKNQGGEHQYGTHLLYRQLSQAGIEMPLASTAPTRKRQRSRRDREAIAEAEAIIREANQGQDC